MPTTLYLRNEGPPILGGASTGRRLLDDVRGLAVVSKVTTTTLSGTNIQVTDGAGGTALAWYSDPLQPVTIAGTITVNLHGLESATTVNAGFGIVLERTKSDGNASSTIIAETTVPAVITELGATDTLITGTFTPTLTALKAGERIKLTVKIRNVGTMAAGTATLSIGAPTGGGAGDSFITFTETVRAYGDVASSAWTGAAQGGIAGWW